MNLDFRIVGVLSALAASALTCFLGWLVPVALLCWIGFEAGLFVWMYRKIIT
jgi:hypothetical protein